jgi:hypothetical protein
VVVVVVVVVVCGVPLFLQLLRSQHTCIPSCHR